MVSNSELVKDKRFDLYINIANNEGIIPATIGLEGCIAYEAFMKGDIKEDDFYAFMASYELPSTRHLLRTLILSSGENGSDKEKTRLKQMADYRTKIRNRDYNAWYELKIKANEFISVYPQDSPTA